MLSPQKTIYRVCPSCSSPIAQNNDHCGNCGHSLLQNPVDKEAEHILRGKVFYNGQWVLMSEKAQHEKYIQEQLASGKVELNGQWVKIEEKVKAHRETTIMNTSKVVDFPLKPLDIPDTENSEEVDPLSETSLSVPMAGKPKSDRPILVIILSIISFLTMTIAAIGIVTKIYPSFWPFH
jgi:hypothetical protein